MIQFDEEPKVTFAAVLMVVRDATKMGLHQVSFEDLPPNVMDRLQEEGFEVFVEDQVTVSWALR